MHRAANIAHDHLRVALVGVLVALFSLACEVAAQPIDAQSPMCIFIYSRLCTVCPKVKPLIVDLEKVYGNKVKFVVLDVTDDASRLESRKTAKELGVSSFVAFCEDAYPTVGIFGPKRKCLKELYGYHPKDSYEKLLQKAINYTQ